MCVRSARPIHRLTYLGDTCCKLLKDSAEVEATSGEQRIPRSGLARRRGERDRRHFRRATRKAATPLFTHPSTAHPAMPRASKHAKPSLPSQTLILDNGAYSIKAGFAPTDEHSEPSCRITPNCIARGRDRRVWIGSQLEQCKDFGEMAFRRPVEKGFIVNWEGEKAIWEQEFLRDDALLKVQYIALQSSSRPDI